jgi:hypothetical protein
VVGLDHGGACDGFGGGVIGRAGADDCSPQDFSGPHYLFPGDNTLVVKVFEGAGGWNFALRFEDASGNPVAWSHSVADSYLTMFGPPDLNDPETFETWGAHDNPYAFPAFRTDYGFVDSPVPSGARRSSRRRSS